MKNLKNKTNDLISDFKYSSKNILKTVLFWITPLWAVGIWAFVPFIAERFDGLLCFILSTSYLIVPILLRGLYYRKVNHVIYSMCILTFGIYLWGLWEILKILMYDNVESAFIIAIVGFILGCILGKVLIAFALNYNHK